MANALFDFDSDGGDRGFEAINGQTYTLRLRQQPPIGVDSVLFQVWDEAGADPSLGIAANPPRASKNAPALTLTGASTGSAVSPATLDGGVTIEAPASGGHSYIVRCVVNGGKRTLTNGKQVVDPTLIHERGFFVRTALGSRKLVCTERQEFEVEGFAGALSDMMESAAGEGGGGGEGIAAGSYYGQPAIWDETAWVPLAPGDAMMLDRIQALGELLIDPGAGAHITAPHVYLDVGVAFGTATLALEGNSVAIGGDEIGFYGTPPQARPGVIAAGEGDATAATLDSLIAALVQIGLITDDRFP